MSLMYYCCCCPSDEDDDDTSYNGYLRLSESNVFERCNDAGRLGKGKFAEWYKLGHQLGKGSTASCYECVEKSTGEKYAVKVINKRRISVMYKDLLPQFRREVDILCKLDHANIIQLKQVFESKVNIHVVTELARGGELFEYLVSKPNSSLTEANVSFLIRQCISAVAHMHSHGVIHRDIKLENILLAEKPKTETSYKDIVLKIIDFGLAKSFDEENRKSPLSTTKTFFGTVGYISPEMMKRRAYTRAVDVWALGVVTFVLLCGVFPFDDSSRRRIRGGTFSIDYKLRYPRWVSGLSESAKDLLSKLLQVDPKKRITALDALKHPWVSGTTASPRNVLNSPGHLRDLMKSSSSNIATETGGVVGNLTILGHDDDNNNNAPVSPLQLDPLPPPSTPLVDDLIQEGEDTSDNDSSSSSSLGSPSMVLST